MLTSPGGTQAISDKKVQHPPELAVGLDAEATGYQGRQDGTAGESWAEESVCGHTESDILGTPVVNCSMMWKVRCIPRCKVSWHASFPYRTFWLKIDAAQRSAIVIAVDLQPRLIWASATYLQSINR